MQLIINADDFGYSYGINQAIIELAKLGTISSTSVMVNQPFTSEITKLIGICGIGLHLNLTQGTPISNPSLIKTLIGSDGNFLPIQVFKKNLKKKLINEKHIVTEFHAQFNLLYNLIEGQINHIDSHQDINKHPKVSSALLEFGSSFKNKVGLRWYNKVYAEKSFNGDIRLFEPRITTITRFGVKRVLTESYFRYYRRKLLSYYKLTDGMLFTLDNNNRSLLKLISESNFNNKNNKSFEIMCHPALTTEELINTKMLSSRLEEYNLLRSEKFTAFSQANNLIKFSDLEE